MRGSHLGFFSFQVSYTEIEEIKEWSDEQGHFIPSGVRFSPEQWSSIDLAAFNLPEWEASMVKFVNLFPFDQHRSAFAIDSNTPDEAGLNHQPP